MLSLENQHNNQFVQIYYLFWTTLFKNKSYYWTNIKYIFQKIYELIITSKPGLIFIILHFEGP